MQYQVPQFIETEDKIIGGILTLKQFLIIAAGAGISFIFYFLFNSFAWLFMTTLVGIIAVGVAFVKVQGRSVPTIIVAAFHYYWNPRFYLWRSGAAEPEAVGEDIEAVSKKAEAPKQFIFHRKEVGQKTLTQGKGKNDIGPTAPMSAELREKVPTAQRAPKETQPIPLGWDKAKPVPSPLGVLRGAAKEAGNFIARESSELMPGEKASAHRALPVRAPAEKTGETRGDFLEKEMEQKKALRTLEEKMLKKEELLEHEVKELENAKARLESEMQKLRLIQEKNATIQKVTHIEKVPPKVRESFAVPTKEVIKEKKMPKETLGIQPREARATTEGAEETLLSIRHKLATAGGKVQDLFQKLSTSKTSLPKRERNLINFGNNSKERLELLRKATGEIESARRIDYSDSRRP